MFEQRAFLLLLTLICVLVQYLESLKPNCRS